MGVGAQLFSLCSSGPGLPVTEKQLAESMACGAGVPSLLAPTCHLPPELCARFPQASEKVLWWGFAPGPPQAPVTLRNGPLTSQEEAQTTQRQAEAGRLPSTAGSTIKLPQNPPYTYRPLCSPPH